MCDEWKNSFVTFSNYVEKELGPRPDGYTLDRIDVDGDYAPGNIRWASHSVQMHNRRPRNVSGIVGVSRRKDTGKWIARIKKGGLRLQKQFDTKAEAEAQRIKWEKEYYG